MSIADLVWNEAREYGVKKWSAGQAKHGGDLTRKPCLKEAIDEAVDMVSYLFVLRNQIEVAKLHLAEALATGSREAIEAALNILNTGNVDGETF